LARSSEKYGPQQQYADLGLRIADMPHKINNDGQTTPHPKPEIMPKLLSRKVTPITITDIAKNIKSPLLLSFKVNTLLLLNLIRSDQVS